jgi:translation initiation factor 2B subunit (eIF-2B alpha/beta/delta family)
MKPVATMDERIAMIRNDREHGSRWLVHEAILILYAIATQTASSPGESLRQLQHAGKELAQARPSMAALAGAVRRIFNASDDLEGIAREAEKLLKEYDSAIERMTDYARPLLYGTLMTHSLSGTVLAVLSACITQIKRVIVLEGRPRYEGREVAIALSNEGVSTTLITDAQADIFLPECHAVVVGADSILANGDILNKAGTALLAWAARGHHLPFYVLCESLKISPQSWSGNLALLEEKEAAEVLEQEIPGVSVRNFYFDRTPSKLVSSVITEQGIMGKSEIKLAVSKMKMRK